MCLCLFLCLSVSLCKFFCMPSKTDIEPGLDPFVACRALRISGAFTVEVLYYIK